MSAREDRGRKILLVVAVVLAAVLVFMVFRICNVLDRMDDSRRAYSNDDSYAYADGRRPEYFMNGIRYVQKPNVETVLLIGIDKYEAAIVDSIGYRNKQQSDALFLLAIDNTEHTYRVLQINRDTVARIRSLDVKGNPYTTFDGQLALSHTYGSGGDDSCRNVVWSVSDFLYGLEIDHYVSFSMDAVSVINDSVGGVTLTVLDDMTPVDETWTPGTEVTLAGEQALSYIRARSSLPVSTNVERMKRQRQYVSALIEQGGEALKNDSSVMADIVKKVSPYIVSDCDTNKLISIADTLLSDGFKGIVTPEGEARVGKRYMEFYVDDAALKTLLLDMFYDMKGSSANAG